MSFFQTNIRTHAASLSRRRFLSTASAGLGAAALAGLAPIARSETAHRNVVLIFIDDLGWRDLGVQSSEFYLTPHIDRLAAEGMRFTDGYAACTVCSPTRASLLTGRYPARVGITDWIRGHSRPWAKLRVPEFHFHLPFDEVTLAESLGEAGYTSASIGKWHLGEEDSYPEAHGFDLNIAGTDRGQPPRYFSPYNIPTLEDGPEGEFLTDRMAAEAARFIDDNRERPFFLYLPLFAVHTPIQAKEELNEKYRERIRPGDDQRNPAYAAMVHSVDDAVGTVMEALRRNGLDENTMVIFTSDNGGLIPVTSNWPLREGKGSAYEGGVRVPLIIRAPGWAEPGSVSEEPSITPDLALTIWEWTGVAAPDRALDGVSLAPALKGEGGLERDAIFWHYPHYHPGGATPYSAMREGDYKLIHYYEDDRLELYNLREDIGESYNLAAIEPERAQAMKERIAAWLQEVDAQMPEPNPDYDPERAGQRG